MPISLFFFPEFSSSERVTMHMVCLLSEHVLTAYILAPFNPSETVCRMEYDHLHGTR